MAVTLTLTQGFCTELEADTHLENITTWNAATDEAKVDAITWGRYYLEQNYYIDLTTITEVVVPEELILANALLAADYIVDSTLFNDSPSVKAESVKAGSVMSKTVYLSSGKQYPPTWLKVKALLQDKYARRGASTVELFRG